jgi:3-oxoadipate CoA-transferase beta subunit
MSMTYTRRTKDQLAARVAQDIPEGATVNLGIGQPTSGGQPHPRQP